MGHKLFLNEIVGTPTINQDQDRDAGNVTDEPQGLRGKVACKGVAANVGWGLGYLNWAGSRVYWSGWIYIRTHMLERVILICYQQVNPRGAPMPLMELLVAREAEAALAAGG